MRKTIHRDAVIPIKVLEHSHPPNPSVHMQANESHWIPDNSLYERSSDERCSKDDHFEGSVPAANERHSLGSWGNR